MDRRSFLKSSALAGAGATGLAAPAFAQDKRTLTMVTTWGRGMIGVHDSAQHVADRITEMTGGTLTVEVKAAGELVGPFEVFDAVASGTADMYHGADYYFTDRHPAYAFFTAVPFGMTAQELVNWYHFDGGMALHDQLGEIFGLKSFLAGNTGAQAGGWFRNEITSPEDFEGLRFRMPGLGGEALGRLGASVQTIPGGDILEALSSGDLDGAEWIGPWADEKAGFQKIAKIYYTAGFHEPGAGLSVAMNRAVFGSLTPAQKAIVKTAALEAHQWTLSRFLSQNGAALQRLRAEGVQLKEFPPEVWDAFGRVSTETLDQYMGDRLFADIRTSVTESLRKSSDWSHRSEGTYRTQRARVFG